MRHYSSFVGVPLKTFTAFLGVLRSLEEDIRALYLTLEGTDLSRHLPGLLTTGDNKKPLR